jgi:adenosylmethionine-8-amino-7-oxononanoate aminotransferase
LDEVLTGFGRTGHKFGADLYGIKPDILVAGKGLAGGYAAICGIFGTDEIATSINDAGLDVMFHTFGALPQSCAAALTVLQIIRRDSLVQRSRKIGQQLKSALNERLSQHPLVAEIRGEGLLIGIEVVEDRSTLKPFDRDEHITDRLVRYGMEKGVFFYPGGTGEVRDILCIGAPFIIGDEEVDLMVDTLEYALNQLLA